MVGYTGLVSRDEAGTLAAMKSMVETLIEPTVARHGGRIVKLMGDGVLAEFASAVDAVSAAIAWQETWQARPDWQEYRFRIGINVGDIVVDGDDIQGDGVILAARLEGEAEPGGICLADTVHRHVAGKVSSSFRDGGETALKNISGTVRIWRWPAVAPAAAASEVADLGDSSIAVLPFDDMSSDPEQAYFCDGITEDLITELAYLPGMSVIARHSSFAYKGRAMDARVIGEELGVRYLVEGSVRRVADRVRITAQLIDSRDGAHLWARRYDRDVDDIFAVQDDVVLEISTALSEKLQQPVAKPVALQHPRNLEAYEYVMRGRQNILRAQGREEAKASLERALALDPTMSDAHAWLAVYYYTDTFLYHRESTAETLAAGFAAADSAIEYGPDNSLAHMALGMVSLYAGRRATALQSLLKALELNPNEADAHCLMQDAYTFDGHPEKGIESAQTAMRLNPHYPEWYLWHLSFAKYCARDYAGAIETLEKLTDISEPLRILAAAHARLGHADKARAAAERFLKAFPNFSSKAWGRTQPFRNPEDLDHVLEGYRLAGLPD